MLAFQRFRVISSGIVSSVSALDTEDHALKERTYKQWSQKGWISAHGRVFCQYAETLGFMPGVPWPSPQNSQIKPLYPPLLSWLYYPKYNKNKRETYVLKSRSSNFANNYSLTDISQAIFSKSWTISFRKIKHLIAFNTGKDMCVNYLNYFAFLLFNRFPPLCPK